MVNQPRVLLCLAKGSDEIESVTLISLLTQAQIQVKVASVEAKGQLTIEGANGINLQCHAPLSRLVDEDFAALILPGGKHGSQNFKQSALLMQAIAHYHAAGKIVAASGSTPGVTLLTTELFSMANLTSSPDTKARVPASQWQERRVVWDHRYNLLTSQGAGTSLDLSLKLIELLQGKARAKQIAAPLALPLGIYDYQDYQENIK